MKAEEHPLSQKQAEEMFNFLLGSGSFEDLSFADDHIGQTGKWWWRSKCVRPLQKRFLELLKAEQELAEQKVITNKTALAYADQKVKIQELEETISAQFENVLSLSKTVTERDKVISAQKKQEEHLQQLLKSSEEAMTKSEADLRIAFEESIKTSQEVREKLDEANETISAHKKEMALLEKLGKDQAADLLEARTQKAATIQRLREIKGSPLLAYTPWLGSKIDDLLAEHGK